MRGQSTERGDARPFIQGKGTKSERWAKKAAGKLYYLGYVRDDPSGDLAWQRWLEVRDEVRAGRTPRRINGALTVAGLINEFLNAKRRSVEQGVISARHHQDLVETCKRLAAGLGKSRPVAGLEPADFGVLRAHLAKRYAAERQKCEITRMKSVFRWGLQNGLLSALPTFGTEFDPPAMRQLRLERAERGQRIFTPAELQLILDGAEPVLAACTLLGLNAAMGAADLSQLTLEQAQEAVGTGWLAMPRHKTGAARKCWLWPETRQALQRALEARPKHVEGDAEQCALLSPWGGRLVSSDGRVDSLGKWFARRLATVGLTGAGLSFYRLRHSFRTVADETLDTPAIDSVMGHLAPGMATRYRQHIADERVERVCRHVHDWAFGTAAGAADPGVKPVLRLVSAG